MRWLRRESPEAARRLREAVLAAARLLGEQPRIGPERPELAPPPLRILVIRDFPYILAYDALPKGGTIIQRILHSSRDIPPCCARLSSSGRHREWLMLEPTLRVDHADMERDFDLYLDIAERQPVEITRDGRPSTVMISLEEYSRLEGLDAQAAREGDAPKAIIHAAATEHATKNHTLSNEGG